MGGDAVLDIGKSGGLGRNIFIFRARSLAFWGSFDAGCVSLEGQNVAFWSSMG